MKLLIIIFVLIIFILYFSKSSFQDNLIYDQCKYSGFGFDENHELGECSVAIQIIPLVNNVIEIGGGAGKVSHMINNLLKLRNLETQHIVVEPGSNGVGNHGDELIYKNREYFGDKYTIVKKLCNDLTYNDFSILKQKPDCLFVDCEGCLHDFFTTDIGIYLLKNVRFIANEMDSFVINKDDQDLRNIWQKYGFTKYGVGLGCGTDCSTEIWSKLN